MFPKVTTKKEALIHLGSIFVIALVMILLFFYVYLPVTTNHGETIKVPDLNGKTVEQVKELLEVNNLRFEVNDSSYVEKAIPSSVISQNPEAGSEVKSNRKIYLIIASKNPPMLPMPNLKDMSLKWSEMKLKSLGLVMLKPTMVPSRYENLVIRQYVNGKEVPAGTFIPKGSRIRLDVGNGDAKVKEE